MLHHIHRLKLICKSKAILAISGLGIMVWNPSLPVMNIHFALCPPNVFIHIIRTAMSKSRYIMNSHWVHSYRYSLLPLSLFMNLYDLQGFFFLFIFGLWRLFIKNFSEPDLKQQFLLPMPRWHLFMVLICTFLSASCFVLCSLTPIPFHSLFVGITFF